MFQRARSYESKNSQGSVISGIAICMIYGFGLFCKWIGKSVWQSVSSCTFPGSYIVWPQLRKANHCFKSNYILCRSYIANTPFSLDYFWIEAVFWHVLDRHTIKWI